MRHSVSALPAFHSAIQPRATLQGDENANSLNRRVMRNIASASYRFPSDVELTPECLDFVSRVLVSDAKERMTAEEMLQHPWLAGKALPGTHIMGESFQSVGDIKEVMGEFPFSSACKSVLSKASSYSASSAVLKWYQFV